MAVSRTDVLDMSAGLSLEDSSGMLQPSGTFWLIKKVLPCCGLILARIELIFFLVAVFLI